MQAIEFRANYENFFQEQIKNPEFAKAYREARLERILNEVLEILKEQIYKNESKGTWLKTIDTMEKQLDSLDA